MEYVLAFVSLLFLLVSFFLCRRAIGIMGRMDAMLEAAINGTFSENDFSESRLSRLESKMVRYLSLEITVGKQIVIEKNAVKQLVSDISHQSKTPISNILLYTQLLAEKKDLDQETKRFVALMEAQAEKLSFLMQALIKTSRLESGIVAVAPKRNSLKELLEQVGKAFEEEINKGRLLLDTSLKLCAFFDFKWTVEAVFNLVDNGLKYTPEEGRVKVSCKDYEMFVKIDIEDNGIGIGEEETAKIFSRFYRSPNVADKDGVGIGLYLAREIINREDGYITVSSELGKGSVFSVFLPKRDF